METPTATNLIPHPQDKDPKRGRRFFVATSTGKLFENPQNLPVEALQKMKKFKGGVSFFRFAYDPDHNTIFIQDNWKDLIASGDPGAWEMLNRALTFLGKTYGVKTAVPRYGDPENCATPKKLSDYGLAWNYIEKYLHGEGMKTEPFDIPVVELMPTEPLKEPIEYRREGFAGEDIKLYDPVLVVDRNQFRSPEGTLDYGRMNHYLIFKYLRYLHDIVSASQDQAQATKVLEFLDTYMGHMDPKGYGLYFATFTRDGPRVFKSDKESKERVQDENSIRDRMRISKCKDCGEVMSGPADECSKCHGKNIQRGEQYKGPIVLFSTIPSRNQIIFQNYHPQDFSANPALAQLFETIKDTVASVGGVEEKDLVITFDPTSASPFISSIKRYEVVWDYVVDYLAPQFDLDPSKLPDIPVVEMDAGVPGMVAAFVSSKEDELTKAPLARDMRISWGISLDYPFIMLGPNISDQGKKYHALLHEYVHFLQRILGYKLETYSFGNAGVSEGTPDQQIQKFVEYINNPDEQESHKQQMAYMLRMGMSPADVLDFFMPDRTRLVERAEYSKILSKAIEVFRKAKERAAKDKATRTASVLPELNINDWWHIGLQEALNSGANEERESRRKTIPFNLKKYKAFSPTTYESMLAPQHDREMGYMKTIEQLLSETRI